MPHFEGVIEVGTTATKLLVAEIQDDDTWHVIDRAELPTPLGHDVFSCGLISRDSLMQCLGTLRRFKELLEGWGLGPAETTVIAMSALREAVNRDAVVDRIFVKTGFRVDTIDGAEENRLMYLALMDCLKDADPKLLDTASLVIEVGGGSTEILLTEKKKIQAAHSLRLGKVMINELVKSVGETGDVVPLLNEHVDNARPWLNSELSMNRIQQFFAIGKDARLAAEQVGETVPTVSGAPSRLWRIHRKAFDSFVAAVTTYSSEERSAHYHIPPSESRYVHIGLLEYQRFLHMTRAETVLVPGANVREGVIISRRSSANPLLRDEFRTQIIASAKSLAKKYNVDDKHSLHVCALAVKLFENLKGELGLETPTGQSYTAANKELRNRTLLEVGAILHDIGIFIHGKNHEIHSAYIINNSEIFGLTREDKRIVERIALYHRGHKIPQQDKDFTMMPRADRVLIMKLASILRLADALDRSHRQEIRDFSLEFRNDVLAITCRTKLRVEKMAVAEKADMFESMFGYRVMLE